LEEDHTVEGEGELYPLSWSVLTGRINDDKKQEDKSSKNTFAHAGEHSRNTSLCKSTI